MYNVTLRSLPPFFLGRVGMGKGSNIRSPIIRTGYVLRMCVSPEWLKANHPPTRCSWMISLCESSIRAEYPSPLNRRIISRLTEINVCRGLRRLEVREGKRIFSPLYDPPEAPDGPKGKNKKKGFDEIILLEIFINCRIPGRRRRKGSESIR